LMETPLAGLLHPEDKDIFLEKYRKRLSGDGRVPTRYSHRIIDKAGEKLLVELTTVRITREGRPAGLCFVRDITRQKKLEAQLQHAQKMEAIATLAGGIAHQFNNALSPITANIEFLEMDFADNGAITNFTNPMRDSAHRMKQLTNQLLAYAKGGKYQAENISMSNFVRKTLPLIRHILHPAVDVDTDLPHGLSSIKVDLTQMQMILTAVLQNASEAIEGKGLIKISSRNKKIKKTDTYNHPGIISGLYVGLTIEDDGKGMDEETKNRVFEPFFTTKFQGRGLSMAAAYGIVKNHDGWISVDSELGKGTIVRIYLPAIDVRVKKAEKPGIETIRDAGAQGFIQKPFSIGEISEKLKEVLK
jgi:signal transduction histidine kinase